MVDLIQPSFSKGEVAPSIYGRVDTAVYRVGLRTARNLVVHTTGGISNRAGTLFVGPVKDHTAAPRLIRFQFKATDNYILEFSNLAMRVIRQGGYVLETGKAITGATKANPCVVTATAHGFSNGDDVFISGVVGMTQLNGRWFKVASAAANTFALTDQATSANVNSTGYSTYTSGGTAARVYTLVTPYAVADLPLLKYTQSADVMTLTHASYEPRELTRTGHTSWTLSTITFTPGQPYPVDQTVTQNGTTGTTEYRYRVTAINEETQEESLPALNTTDVTAASATAANPVVVTATAHGFLNGDEVEINGFVQMTQVNGRRFTVANQTANTFELKGENGTGYAPETTGGIANLTFTRITNGNATLSVTDNISVAWAAASGARRHVVYKYKNGLYGLLQETETASFTDDGSYAPDFGSSPPQVREPFRGTGNYPGVASYYEQRRVFGGSLNLPDTSDFSQTANADNFTVSTPTRPDDAIRATLTSREVNEIRAYVPTTDLLVLTGGEEWRVSAGSDSAFAPETIRQKPQSAWGSSHVRPLVVGDSILMVQEGQKIIRALDLDFVPDKYVGSDLTILSSHLFRTCAIVDWAVSNYPEPLVVAVRDDGQVCVLTYHKAQQVLAWTRWDFWNGAAEAVMAVRESPGDPDETIYFVVRRKVGGATVRYLEKMHPREFIGEPCGDACTHAVAPDVQNAHFVDCGAVLDNPITVTGVSNANPMVVTAPAHGLSNGSQVNMAGVVWQPTFDANFTEVPPKQFGDTNYFVYNVTSDTFELYHHNMTWTQVVAGTDISTGSLDAPYKFSLATLSCGGAAARVAAAWYASSGDMQLQTWDFNGSAWVPVSAATILDAGANVSITALTSTRIAFADHGNKQVRAYDFDGTNWAQVGNGLTYISPGVSEPGIAALTSTRIALVDVDLVDDYPQGMGLAAYDFDGTNWVQVGNKRNLYTDNGLLGDMQIAAISPALHIVLADSNQDSTLQVYVFDGLAWTPVGSKINMQTILGADPQKVGITCIKKGSASAAGAVVVFTDAATQKIATMSFDGAAWHQQGPITTGPVQTDQSALTTLGEQAFAIVNDLDDVLRVYSLGGAALSCSAVYQGGVDGTTFSPYKECGEVRLVTSTVGNLWHLEGETLIALANGEVATGLTVASGQVTLAEGASRVHVGYRVVADLETLDVDMPGQGGTIQGRIKRIPRVTVRFEQSRGLLVGPDTSDLVAVADSEFADAGSTELLTGDVDITPPAHWNSNGRVFLRQKDPLPMTILAVIPRELEAGEGEQ